MREIKFRGKREDNGEWVFGCYLETQMSGVYIIGSTMEAKGKKESIKMHDKLWQHEVIPETVGQFTGLKDKNGVEIFEGDRLKRIGDDGDGIFIIEWNEQSGGFNLNYIYFDEIYDLEELWPDSQVIGNIHDKAGDE